MALGHVTLHALGYQLAPFVRAGLVSELAIANVLQTALGLGVTRHKDITEHQQAGLRLGRHRRFSSRTTPLAIATANIPVSRPNPNHTANRNCSTSIHLLRSSRSRQT